MESNQTVGEGSFASLDQASVKTDIRYAIALANIHLNSLFDRDRDDEPFFFSSYREDGFGECLHLVDIGTPHVVGRCLWASMVAEETTGIPFPEEGLQILTRYCQSSFENEDNLNSYFDPTRNNERFIECHNLREGLLGLVALIGGRNSKWARDKAVAMISTLTSLTDKDGHLSAAKADELGMLERMTGDSFGCLTVGYDSLTTGRLVGPLIFYHKLTGNKEALRLAGLYVRATLASTFTANGHFKSHAETGGHIHSITSSLSGIAIYAEYTNDIAMLNTCRMIMDVGIPEYFSSWGWGDEVMDEHPANLQLRGEVNQTGDIVRTALVLGRTISSEYYEIAERFLRNMLLQCQHTESELKSFMMENPNPANDSERDVLDRTIGGYAMQFPNDRMREGSWPLSTLDITSGAVHAMSECWRNRIDSDGNGIRINLLFDYSGTDVDVKSGLPFTGEISFFCKSTKNLYLRIPGWVDPDSVRVEINGREQDNPVFQDGYLGIAATQGDVGIVRFDIPMKQEKEMVDGVEFDVKWLGNQAVEILPKGTISPLPF